MALHPPHLIGKRPSRKGSGFSARNVRLATESAVAVPPMLGGGCYPRAADLISRDSQSYSDQEVFWIVKNGIRLSGMPAFGKVESDEHMWDLVLYFRALPKGTSQSAR